MKIRITDSSELRKILKFLIVGCLNTGLTYLIYIVCRWMDLSPVISNTLGYIGGMINSYVWNRKWVFRSHSPQVLWQMGFFFGSFLVCFGIQLALFKSLLTHTSWNEYLVQFLSMVVYTGLNYLFNRKWTFRDLKRR